MKYSVTVTDSDIRYGAPRRPAACPIKIALCRAGIEDLCPTAGGIVRIKRKDDGLIERALIDTPIEVVHFIRRFDLMQKVFPFIFEIEVPE